MPIQRAAQSIFIALRGDLGVNDFTWFSSDHDHDERSVTVVADVGGEAAMLDERLHRPCTALGRLSATRFLRLASALLGSDSS